MKYRFPSAVRSVILSFFVNKYTFFFFLPMQLYLFLYSICLCIIIVLFLVAEPLRKGFSQLHETSVNLCIFAQPLFDFLILFSLDLFLISWFISPCFQCDSDSSDDSAALIKPDKTKKVRHTFFNCPGSMYTNRLSLNVLVKPRGLGYGLELIRLLSTNQPDYHSRQEFKT